MTYLSLLAAFLAFLLILTGCTAKTADDPNEKKPFEIAVKEINKTGNILLDATLKQLKDRDIEPADIITIIISGKSYDVPVGTSFTDVDSGCMICRLNSEADTVKLIINGGSFAEVTEMAVKETINEDPGYRWNRI